MKGPGLTIRPVQKTDAKNVAAIYNYYVLYSIITFEEKPVSINEQTHRIKAAQQSNMPWLVCLKKNQIIGFAKVAPWKKRSAYRCTVESTIYVKPEYTGKGTGGFQYKALLSELGPQKVHSIIAGIALPNEASIALHKKFGFVKAAHLEQVGFKFNKWINVEYWQLLLKSDKNENPSE